MDGEPITDKEKATIATDFIVHAPPGEFSEVINDVRSILNNDQIIKEQCSGAFVQYNKDQFIPAKLEGADKPTLVTHYNDMGSGDRFLDPNAAKTFRFDHLRRETSDIQSFEPSDANTERWRKAVQVELDNYIAEHYEKSGIGVVFGRVDGGQPILTVCIESHQFQPRNYWNGRWRSQWTIAITNDKVIDLKGFLRVQVHYYEDGNVQLVSSKEAICHVDSTNDPDAFAKTAVHIISDEENKYQLAMQDNYQMMSENTFKALRRQLPMTRTKFDWQKVNAYRVSSELKPPM